MVAVVVEGPGLRSLDLLIQGLDRVARPDFRAAVLKNLGQESQKLLRREFERTVNPYGEAWLPLASPRDHASSFAARNAKGQYVGGMQNDKPLNDTGRLRNSLTSGLSISPLGADTLKIGTNVAYAAAHQFGSTHVVTHGTRTNAHQINGRFMSRKAAGKRQQPEGRNFVRTSITFAYSHRVKIPARPFFPLASRGLGEIWSEAFTRIAGRMIRRELTRR